MTATDNAKRKAPDMVRSPKGIFFFPHLTIPDTGPKDKPGAPKYKTDLIVDPSDEGVKQYLTDIESAATTAFTKEQDRLKDVLAAAKTPKEKKDAQAALDALTLRVPIKDHYDKDGNETGKVRVSYSSTASYKNRKTGKEVSNKPAIYGPNAKPTKAAPTIGSEGYVTSYLSPYVTGPNAGVTLRVVSAMITKLRQPLTPRDADYYGYAPEGDALDEGDALMDTPDTGADDSDGSADGHAF